MLMSSDFVDSFYVTGKSLQHEACSVLLYLEALRWQACNQSG